jgi:co-chaperonin GroES (HSP10)
MQVGDKVIFGRHSGAWLDATYGNRGEANDDGKLFICQDADILAVIKGE